MHGVLLCFWSDEATTSLEAIRKLACAKYVNASEVGESVGRAASDSICSGCTGGGGVWNHEIVRLTVQRRR